MSNEALTWAFNQKLKPSTDKFVLIALADYADENGSCFPSHQKTADRTGASVATVRRAVQRLEESGYITVERRHRGDGSQSSNRYVLNLKGAQTSPAQNEHPPVQNEQGGAQSEQGGAHSVYGGVLTHEQGGCSPVSTHEPSEEPSLIPHSSLAAIAPPAEKQPTAQTLVREWIDHRTEVTGQKPTGRTIGHLSKEIKNLLDEGQPYDDVRAGLQLWDTKAMHPSTLASFVDQARTPARTTATRQQQHAQDVIAGALAHAASGAPNPYMAGEDR